eukprot:674664-Pyramimonas_sp.AAC.1
MDYPVVPEYYAEINETPMVGQVAQNQVTRDMANDFYRIADISAMSYHPSPTDPDATVQPLVFALDSFASTFPSYLHDIHAVMQARMQAADEARWAARDRNMRRTQHIAKRNAMRGHVPTAMSKQSS